MEGRIPKIKNGETMIKQGKKLNLFLKVKWPYIAVKIDCNERANIGVIGKDHRGSGSPGVLSVTPELDRMLAGSCTSHPAFRPKPISGALRRGVSSVCIGEVLFEAIDNAVAFLRSLSMVIFCPVGGHIQFPNGSMVPIPDVSRSDYWHTLRDVLCRAIKRAQSPVKIVFRGGGVVPIPAWFKQWCAQQGLAIEILPPDEYDAMYSCERMFPADRIG